MKQIKGTHLDSPYFENKTFKKKLKLRIQKHNFVVLTGFEPVFLPKQVASK